MSKRVLNISYDESLLQTRHWILEQAGYEVKSALGFMEAEAECRNGRFDLVIVGHSLPRRDKIALAEATRSGCRAKVLSLRKQGQEPIPEADYASDSIDPDGLLEAVRNALGSAG